MKLDNMSVFCSNRITKLEEALMKPLWQMKKKMSDLFNGDKKSIRM